MSCCVIMFVYLGDYQYYGYHPPQAGLCQHYSHHHLHHHQPPPPPPACCQYYNYNYNYNQLHQAAVSHRASIASLRALNQGQF